MTDELIIKDLHVSIEGKKILNGSYGKKEYASFLTLLRTQGGLFLRTLNTGDIIQKRCLKQ